MDLKKIWLRMQNGFMWHRIMATGEPSCLMKARLFFFSLMVISYFKKSYITEIIGWVVVFSLFLSIINIFQNMSSRFFTLEALCKNLNAYCTEVRAGRSPATSEIVTPAKCQKLYGHSVCGDTKNTFYTFMKFRCSENQGEIIRLVILFLQYYVHMDDLEN